MTFFQNYRQFFIIIGSIMLFIFVFTVTLLLLLLCTNVSESFLSKIFKSSSFLQYEIIIIIHFITFECIVSLKIFESSIDPGLILRLTFKQPATGLETSFA